VASILRDEILAPGTQEVIANGLGKTRSYGFVRGVPGDWHPYRDSHLVASLLKRWLLGTHQGAISQGHLDYYLDEFTFRFNRRKSRSRGKLFLRLAEQAVAVGPAPYKSIVKCFAQADNADHNM
jgi:ISXO2-like transposase domain